MSVRSLGVLVREWYPVTGSVGVPPRLETLDSNHCNWDAILPSGDDHGVRVTVEVSQWEDESVPPVSLPESASELRG